MIKRDSFFFWPQDGTVSLEAYLPSEGEKLPSVVILPGGAYFALSQKEGAEVAEFFAKKGFAAFVLRYSTLHPSFDMPHSPVNIHTVFPEPLYELAFAIKLIRDNAEEFNVDKDKVSIMGFSAGGHLAANFANCWSGEDIASALGFEKEDIRPNCCILCYAATKLHRASKTMNYAIFGTADGLKDEDLRCWSAAESVNAFTPPSFLWHSNTDTMVPVSQSYEMAEALAEAGVCHELHVFSSGEHASGLSAGQPAEAWTELAINFINRHV